jgi:hypothetical protein
LLELKTKIKTLSNVYETLRLSINMPLEECNCVDEFKLRSAHRDLRVNCQVKNEFLVKKFKNKKIELSNFKKEFNNLTNNLEEIQAKINYMDEYPPWFVLSLLLCFIKLKQI